MCVRSRRRPPSGGRARGTDGHRPQRLERRPALVLGQDRRLGDASGERVGPGDGGFRGPVAGLLATRHDEDRGDPVLVEVDRVVEPGLRDL